MAEAQSEPSPAAGERNSTAPEQPAPERPAPVDPPMVPFAIAGLVCWAVAGLVLLSFFRDWLTRHDHTDWLWVCLAGFLVGLPGLATMVRYDAGRRRRRGGR